MVDNCSNVAPTGTTKQQLHQQEQLNSSKKHEHCNRIQLVVHNCSNVTTTTPSRQQQEQDLSEMNTLIGGQMLQHYTNNNNNKATEDMNNNNETKKQNNITQLMVDNCSNLATAITLKQQQKHKVSQKNTATQHPT